jgi:pimeloyl-ACP methyl ester carboxylesterase
VPRVAILIHGGFHGGWCWSRVVPRLQREGWMVHAPSLTGLADRAHLLTPDVGLETHVQDILGLIECEELSEVLLCAHSAGGSVAAVVADRVPERVKAIVYIDAIVPRSGESTMDVLTEEQGVPALFRRLAAEQGEGWRVPPAVFSAGDFGVEEPAVLSDGSGATPQRTYIRCERFPITFGEPLVSRFEQDPAWRTERWDAGHDAMITMPARVTEALLRAAGSTP